MSDKNGLDPVGAAMLEGKSHPRLRDLDCTFRTMSKAIDDPASLT